MNKLSLLAILLCVLFVSKSNAQGDLELAKTYYDAPANKKIKEIYHQEQVVKIIPDKQHHGEYRDTVYYIKNGPYTFYHENGNAQVTGFYSSEKKDSLWRYYDPKGTLLKTEKYKMGQLVK